MNITRGPSSRTEASPAPVTEAAAALRLAVMRLARRLRQQAPDGVSPSQLSVLSTLERTGPTTLGALAETERVKPPTMTRIVAALEDAGLVSRSPDAHDRRSFKIQLSASGRRFVSGSRTRKTAYLVDRLRSLDRKEAAILQRAIPILEKLLDEDSG